MDVEYLHFYVKNATLWRDWFVKTLDFQPVSTTLFGSLSEFTVQSAQILILISSEKARKPAIKQFLHNHAEGVADVAFRVKNLDKFTAQIQRGGGQLTHPVQYQKTALGVFRWCRIRGWGSVSHTLIEHQDNIHSVGNGQITALRNHTATGWQKPKSSLPWENIDHVVLNVPSGKLEQAVAWYENHLGFVRQQQFAITTPQSGLRSFVLRHPQGNATLPINEPTSRNSQIQEFLDLHGGSGIQHVALRTQDLVKTVSLLRRRQVPFLSVPSTYYQQLRKRPGFWQEAGDWEEIAQQQILVDWPSDEPQTRLLQTFTLPLFEQPTFFWEVIERQTKMTSSGMRRAEGFGAGNFQALFEAIEREQQQRGSL